MKRCFVNLGNLDSVPNHIRDYSFRIVPPHFPCLSSEISHYEQLIHLLNIQMQRQKL